MRTLRMTTQIVVQYSSAHHRRAAGFPRIFPLVRHVCSFSVPNPQERIPHMRMSSMSHYTRQHTHSRSDLLPGLVEICYQRRQQRPKLQTYSFSSSSRSSSSQKNSSSSFQLDALKFSVSPEKALSKFQKWAVEDQGLNYLLQWNNIQISAAYVPVWSFDLNVRFVTTVKSAGGRTQTHTHWKPQPFRDAYPSHHSVVHIPGLAMYAGHTYRRSLINPLHDTALVFMGENTIPFGTWMLKDMELTTSSKNEKPQSIQVFPDPWNTTRGRAFALLHEELEDLVYADPDVPAHESVQVQTELLNSRRVYMPTFVIDYSVVGGAEYRAFVSGCDAGAHVSGVSHQVFSFSNQDMYQASTSFLSQVSNVARAGMGVLGGTRHAGGIFVLVLNLLGNVMVRVLARLPLISFVGGLFVGFRKLVRPWMDNRSASASWERQRDHETYMQDHHDHHTDDFVDTSGAARKYFQQHKRQILQHLGGDNTHQEGDFDWYKDWEEWARRQWEQQQQQQQQQTYRQQQQQYQKQQPRQQQQQKAKPEYQWDFNPNDPYSVLGIRRGATKSEVSAAFRKEMLKHHPDVQANASDAQKARSVERSKLITDAYRKIKAEMK